MATVPGSKRQLIIRGDAFIKTGATNNDILLGDGTTKTISELGDGAYVNVGGDTMTGDLRIKSENTSGTINWDINLYNHATDNLDSAVGIVFNTGYIDPNRGKGGLVYEYDKSLGWNRGDFHILQSDSANNSRVDINSKALTIKNNKDAIFYGKIIKSDSSNSEILLGGGGTKEISFVTGVTDRRVFDSLEAVTTQAKSFVIGRIYYCPEHWSSISPHLTIKLTEEYYSSSSVEYRLYYDYRSDNANEPKLQIKDFTGHLHDTNKYQVKLGPHTAAGWDKSTQPVYYSDIIVEVSSYKRVRVEVSSHGHEILDNDISSGDGTIIHPSPVVTDITYTDITKDKVYIGNGKALWSEFDFSSTDISNWNTAYGWGDHSTEGYLTTESDTLQSVTDRGNYTNRELRLSRGDTGTVIQTLNGSASDSPQFFIKHDNGNVKIGNDRGNIKITDTQLFLQNDGGSEYSYIDKSGVTFHRSNSYLKPTDNGTKILYIGGYGVGDNDWSQVKISANNVTINDNNVYHSGNLTNVSQLANDAGYITEAQDNQTLSWDGNSGNLSISNGNTVGLDGRYLRKYQWTANAIDNTDYKTIAFITGDQLASSIKLVLIGTANSVVVNTTVDILVNHSGDIYIESQSGLYTEISLKIESDGNDDFYILVKTNGPNPVNLRCKLYRNNFETVTTYSNGFTPTGTTTTLEHVCRKGAKAISNTGGQNARLYIQDNLGYHAGNLSLGWNGSTGQLSLTNGNTIDIDGRYLEKTGGTLSGPLTVNEQLNVYKTISDSSNSWIFKIQSNPNNFSGYWTNNGNVSQILRKVSGDIGIYLRPETTSTFDNGITSESTIEAQNFIKTGGSNSQILMADGSINDKNDYTIWSQEYTGSVATAGWVTIANFTGARGRAEFYVYDTESGDHAFMHIQAIRSYNSSSVTILNSGGHSMRIQGARFIKTDADITYGPRKLQVYVSTASVYRMKYTTGSFITGWNTISPVSPVLEDLPTGMSVQSYVDGFTEKEGGMGHAGYIRAGESIHADENMYAKSFVKAGGDGTNVLLDDGNIKPLSYFETEGDYLLRDGSLPMTGDLGIGGLPDEGINLHIKSTQARFLVENTQTNAEWVRFSAGTVGSSMKFSNTGSFSIGGVASKTDTSIVEDFYMSGSTGYVGLGNSSPSTRLDVTGDITSDALFTPIVKTDVPDTYLLLGNDGGRVKIGGDAAISRVYANSNHLGIGTERNSDNIYLITGDSKTTRVTISGSTGDATFGGKIIKSDSSDSEILLGGGGTKAVSDFAIAEPRRKKFSVEDESNITGNKWYKIATVNTGNSGITLKGSFNNHVANNGTQKFDLSFYGRASSNVNISITGTYQVYENGVGIVVVKNGNLSAGLYNNHDIYVKTTKYSHVEIDAIIEGRYNSNVTWYENPTPVTIEPTGEETVFDNSTSPRGDYYVNENTIYDNYNSSNLTPDDYLKRDGSLVMTGNLGFSNTSQGTGIDFSTTTNFKSWIKKHYFNGGHLEIAAAAQVYFMDSNDSSVGITFHNGDGWGEFNGYVQADSFININSSDSEVLLGGGGTKLLSELSLEGHTHPYTDINFSKTSDSVDGNVNNALLWDNGVYTMAVSGNNTTYPAGYGTLATFKNTDMRMFQLFHKHTAGSADLWVRSLYSQDASEWHKIWNDGNLQSLSDLTDDLEYVDLSTNQEINGIKSFNDTLELNKTVGGWDTVMQFNSGTYTDNYGSAIFMKTSGSPSADRYGAKFGAIRSDLGSNGAADFVLSLENETATGLVERLRVRANGNVGIGTTNPTHLLEVAGEVKLNGVTILSSGATRSINTHSDAGRLQLNGGTNSTGGATIEIVGNSYGAINNAIYLRGEKSFIETELDINGLTTITKTDTPGDIVFDIQGSAGQLFSVTDSLEGDLFSVNDISGLPILNVHSDDIVTINGTTISDSFVKKDGLGSEFLMADGSVSTIDAIADDRFVNVDGDTMTGSLIVDTNTTYPIELKSGGVDQGAIGIKFNGNGLGTQTGYIHGDHFDVNSQGGGYSFHIGSSEGATNVILDDVNSKFIVGTNTVYHGGNLNPVTLDTDQTITGRKTFTNYVFLGGGEITPSAATLQVNGFMRTGNIYLHSGGATPNDSYSNNYLSNNAGSLTWTGQTVYHTGNLPNRRWSEIDYTPTTLSGYGITDAVNLSGPQTISGEKTFSVIQSMAPGFKGGSISDLNIFTNNDRLVKYDRFSGSATGAHAGVVNNANAVLTLTSHSGPYGKQISFGDTDDLYIRQFSNNNPTTWRKLWHDGNLTKLSDLTDDLTYDNYQSWNLKTNGVQRTTVQSGGTLDIVGQNNISASYSAGGVVTLDGTHDHDNQYLGINAKAVDSEKVDGVSGERIVYGSNQSGSNGASATWDSSQLSQYKSGFWDVNGADWAPDTGWWWGITAAHQSNSPTYNYSGQLVFKNSTGVTDARVRTIGNNGNPSSWYKLHHSGNLSKLTDLTNDLQYITPGNGLSGSTFNGSTARTWDLDEDWLDGKYFDLDGNNTATGNNTFNGDVTVTNSQFLVDTSNGLDPFIVARYINSVPTENIKLWVEDLIGHFYYTEDERNGRIKFTLDNTDSTNGGVNANLTTFEIVGNENESYLTLNGDTILHEGNVGNYVSDTDTTYSAGTGITLSGTTFSLDTSYTDNRYLTSETSNEKQWNWKFIKYDGNIGPLSGSAQDMDTWRKTYFAYPTQPTQTTYPKQAEGYVNTDTNVNSNGIFGGSSQANLFAGDDTYHAYIYTYIYVEEEFTLTDMAFNGDDQHALFINEQHVVSGTVCCTNTLYTHTFKRGWHKIELMYTEGGGGDWIQLGWNPTDYKGYISDMVPHRGGNYNVSQLINDAGYLKGEDITLQSVTDIGNTTTNDITVGYTNVNGGVNFLNGATDFRIYNNSGNNELFVRDTTNANMLMTYGVGYVTSNAAFFADNGATITGELKVKNISPHTSDGITISGDYNNGTGRGSKLYMGGNTDAIAEFMIGDINQDLDGEFIVRNRSTTTLGTTLFDHMSSVRFNVDGVDSVYHEFTNTKYKFMNNDSIPDGTEIGLGDILLRGGSGGSNTMRIAQTGGNSNSVIDSSITLVLSAGTSDYTFNTSGILETSSGFTGTHFGGTSGAPSSTIWAISPDYTGYGIFYEQSTPDKINFKFNNVVKASISLDDGDFTGRKFIKSGATSDDVLLGDGSTTSLSGISGGGGGPQSNYGLQFLSNDDVGTNIATGKTVTGADTPSRVNNGNKDSTSYTGFGSGSGNGSGSESGYVQIDLGSVTQVGQHKIYFYNSDGRRYYYKLKYSIDAVTWYYAIGDGNNWVMSYEPGTSEDVDYTNVIVPPTNARYWRVYADGNTVNGGNHMYEWEIFDHASFPKTSNSFEGLWDASTLEGNSLYAGSGTSDGFAFGVGTTLSTWFAYDGSLSRMIDVYNDGSKIDFNVLPEYSGSSLATQSWVGSSYLPLAGGTLTGNLTMGGGKVIAHNTTGTRDKIRLWSSGSFAIGMDNGFTFGGISNEYAMTFQMNNSSTRGFWWGDEAHTNAQGAMALTTDGKLTLAHSIRVGYGESDTTIPGATHRLDVNGSVIATSFNEGSLRELKTNIEPFTLSGLDLINVLDIVTFDRKDGNSKNKIGIIADDTPKEFLSEEQNAVDLYKTTFVQAKAIQELNAKVEKQTEQINKQAQEIEELKRLVNQLIDNGKNS